MKLRFTWSAYKIAAYRNYRLIIRNHWHDNFNDKFLIAIDKDWQGYDLRVYRIGLFNIALCLLVKRQQPVTTNRAR